MAAHNLKFAADASREVPVADFVPYTGHVTSRIVKTKDGAYCSTWRVDGITWKTSDPKDLLIRHEGLNEMIRGLGNNTSIWIHRIRRPVSDRLRAIGNVSLMPEMLLNTETVSRNWRGFAAAYTAGCVQPFISPVVTGECFKLGRGHKTLFTFFVFVHCAFHSGTPSL
jgi:hypothetical protein